MFADIQNFALRAHCVHGIPLVKGRGGGSGKQLHRASALRSCNGPLAESRPPALYVHDCTSDLPLGVRVMLHKMTVS